MLDKLNPFKSLSGESKSAIGMFTTVVNKLKSVNDRAAKVREINNAEIITLSAKRDALDAKDKEMAELQANNNKTISKIKNILNSLAYS